jgi:hypothetical protein
MAASARVTEANPSFVFHQFVDQTNEFNWRMKPQFMLHRDLNGHTNVCSSAHAVTIDPLAAEFGAVVLDWSPEESRDGTRRLRAAIEFSDRSLKCGSGKNDLSTFVPGEVAAN